MKIKSMISKNFMCFALIIGLFSTGCATLMSDGVDGVSFQANVPDVKLSVDGNMIGKLPLKHVFDRKPQSYKLKFYKEGYETQEIPLAHEFNYNTGMLLDITGTFTFLTPGAVDALTGNLIRYTPTDYQIEMIPIKSSKTEWYQKRVRSKQFMASNFENVRREIAKGEGEYYDSLAGSFFLPAKHWKEFQAMLEIHQEELVVSENSRILWDRVNDLIKNNPALESYSLG